MNKLAIALAVLISIALGITGGYFYRDMQAAPIISSLSAVAEVLRNQEAKAQAAYEATQQELAANQQELDATISTHKEQLSKIRERYVVSESSLKLALTKSRQAVALAEVVPEPPPIIIPDFTTLSITECLADLRVAVRWEEVATKRKAAIESLKVVNTEYKSLNETLMQGMGEERAYRYAVKEQRDLWKKRFDEADLRVNKLKGSRLKWTAGAIAGVVLGFYVGGR